jgi:RNA polymerase sigma factor (TIGR02999 family)
LGGAAAPPYLGGQCADPLDLIVASKSIFILRPPLVTFLSVSEVTHILDRVQQGDARAAEELLPLVYEELRKLAAHKMAHEAAGQTLQPTALVHEAWLRLAGEEKERWAGRAQFFAAAAEAMRRILIERARRRRAQKRGGDFEHQPLEESRIELAAPADEILAVHDALDRLAAEDSQAADLVKLRYFVGMNMPEAAAALGMPQRSAERLWTFARAWLRGAMK